MSLLTECEQELCKEISFSSLLFQQLKDSGIWTWKLNQNAVILFQENVIKNIAFKVAAILSSLTVNSNYVYNFIILWGISHHSAENSGDKWYNWGIPHPLHRSIYNPVNVKIIPDIKPAFVNDLQATFPCLYGSFNKIFDWNQPQLCWWPGVGVTKAQFFDILLLWICRI